MPCSKTCALKKRRRTDGEGTSQGDAMRYPFNIKEEDKEFFYYHQEKNLIKLNVVFDWNVVHQFRYLDRFQELLADHA